MVSSSAAPCVAIIGLSRTINGATSTQTQQGLGFGGVLIGAAIAVTAETFQLPDAVVVTRIGSWPLPACSSSPSSPSGRSNGPKAGRPRLDLAATMVGFFSFVVGSVYH